MTTTNNITNRNNFHANVGNLVYLLLVVITVIIKPLGAIVV